ncbi:hypothetical protein ALC53_06284, partial [Atta colombica]
KAAAGNSARVARWETCPATRERRTCEADEARALFRMNFYEISQHKTRRSPIGTYVRTLHPDYLLLLLLLLLLLSINRPGTGWYWSGKHVLPRASVDRGEREARYKPGESIAYHIGSGEISSGKSLNPTVHPSFGYSLVGPRSFCTGRIKFAPDATGTGVGDRHFHTKEKDCALISKQKPVRTKKKLRQNSLQDCCLIKNIKQ